MRIALVHSFYRSTTPSGENVVVLRQAEALQNAGHDITVVARHTDDESLKRLYTLRSAFTVATGIGPDPTDELSRFQPDIVHIHNLFPNFGERWIGRWGGPLVATMHNFRSICANGLLFRDGEICTECLGGSSWNAVRHGCYHDSRVASLPLAIHNSGGLRRSRLIGRADRLIVLSERTRRVFVESGPSSLAKKVVVIPNGLVDRARPEAVIRTHWSFVGRLSAEKGIRELMEHWPEGEPLVVVGDGPLRSQLASSAPTNVTFTGALDQDGVDGVLRSSWGLVFPSRWYEGFPTVVAEALMHGTPVLAHAGNSGGDFVVSTEAGRVYEDEVQINGALQASRREQAALIRSSRAAFEEHLRVDVWVDRLEALYRAAVAAHGTAP